MWQYLLLLLLLLLLWMAMLTRTPLIMRVVAVEWMTSLALAMTSHWMEPDWVQKNEPMGREGRGRGCVRTRYKLI